LILAYSECIKEKRFAEKDLERAEERIYLLQDVCRKSGSPSDFLEKGVEILKEKEVTNMINKNIM
jgi:hypothetical protein